MIHLIPPPMICDDPQCSDNPSTIVHVAGITLDKVFAGLRMLQFRNAVGSQKWFVCRTILAAITAGMCQTERRDEFKEHLGCAVKRMS